MIPIPPAMPAATPATAVALSAAHQHSGQVTIVWMLSIASLLLVLVSIILLLLKYNK